MGDSEQVQARLTPLRFSDLEGWRDDDHAAAFAAFRRGAVVCEQFPPKPRSIAIDTDRLAVLLRASAEMSPTGDEARAFFEENFRPVAVEPPDGSAHFTGYYEPEVEGSLLRTTRFSVPLLKPPPDLVEIAPGSVAALDPTFRFARRTASGLAEHPDRAAIEAGALAGQDLALVYVADPVEAFFIHIQGAARITLGGGRTMRVTYAAKTGHPYTPIGRVLIEMGALQKGAATMATIRAWLLAHPREAAGVMAQNRSFIFFREAPVDNPADGPIAAAKVPLTAGRSLAVDRLLHAFHTPVWVETTRPDRAMLRQLMVAQDTGSAILGPARGDIFFGSGAAAGDIAGAMNARGRFVLLMPREGAS